MTSFLTLPEVTATGEQVKRTATLNKCRIVTYSNAVNNCYPLGHMHPGCILTLVRDEPLK